MSVYGSSQSYLFQSGNDDWSKSLESIFSIQKFTKIIKSDFDLRAFSNIDLTVSELELRNLHLKGYHSKTDNWELKLKDSRFPHVACTRSLLRDELDMLKINMSLQEKVSSRFRESKSSSKNRNKVFKGDCFIVKKPKSEKVKDLVRAIEASDTAKTDKVIWKFLKRNSSLRREYLSFKKLIEVQDLRLPGFRLLNPEPVKITCPNCRFFITTKTENICTTRTSLLSLGLTLLGFCSASLMMLTVKDTVHLCPFCKIYLGFCPALGMRRLLTNYFWRNTRRNSMKKPREMVSASSTSAKNLFAEPKLRLCDRVQVNVNNVAAIARQIQRGSKSSENLISAAKNFALQEAAIENSETNLKKLKLLTTHIHNQLDSLHNCSSDIEMVLEQVRSMQR